MPALEHELLALALIAALTYATRIGGVLLMQFTGPHPRAESLLRHLSGSVLAALCGPALLFGDIALRLGVITGIAIMLASRNALAALLASVVVTGTIRAHS